MRRVVRLAHRRTDVPVVLVLALVGAGLATGPGSAQLPPTCAEGVPVDCRLPGWDANAADPASPFGPIDGAVWLSDEAGDVPPAGLDVLAVGIGQATIMDPVAVRDAEGILTRGDPSKAIHAGPGLVVRVVLDRSAEDIETGHSGVHVATDADGSRTNNAPGGVGSPDSAFAGRQDVYSLTYATTTGKTKLLTSDLADGWYRGRGRFAASWAAPGVLDMLVPLEAFGDGFSVATYVSGPEGGYDTVSLGPAAIPRDAAVGLLPTCIEGTVQVGPYTVTRLTDDGQTLRDVETPASWRGGARIPIDEAVRTAARSRMADEGEDTASFLALPATVSLFEDGVVVGQRPVLEVAIAGDEAELALTLGLTRRGYDVVRAIELEPTGDEVLDAWLARATDALTETMPPFRSTKRSGLVAGAATERCLGALGAPSG